MDESTLEVPKDMRHKINQKQDIASPHKENTLRFSLPIIDTRKQPDPVQVKILQESLQTDNLDMHLQRLHKTLGVYAARQPTDLAVKIVDGGTMGGEVIINSDFPGRLIDFSLPSEDQIEQMRQLPHPRFGVLPVNTFNMLLFATAASTIKHESAHGLVDSTPTSQFAQDFQKLTGIENIDGEVATLLDEGIAYAFQGMDAPSVEPVGSLVPIASETDDITARTRKVLGEKLRPLLAAYIHDEKQLDEAFFTVAGEYIDAVNLNEYISACKRKKQERASSPA